MSLVSQHRPEAIALFFWNFEQKLENQIQLLTIFSGMKLIKDVLYALRSSKPHILA